MAAPSCAATASSSRVVGTIEALPWFGEGDDRPGDPVVQWQRDRRQRLQRGEIGGAIRPHPIAAGDPQPLIERVIEGDSEGGQAQFLAQPRGDRLERPVEIGLAQ